VHSTVAAVTKSLNTTHAIVTYLCDCVTAVGRDAVDVVRDGVGPGAPRDRELRVARAGRAGRAGVTLSRGSQPVSALNLSPTSTLDISANGVMGRRHHVLAASLDKDVRYNTRSPGHDVRRVRPEVFRRP
jgi:hypothetical protein